MLQEELDRQAALAAEEARCQEEAEAGAARGKKAAPKAEAPEAELELAASA